MTKAERYLRQSVELARANVAAGGLPFGAVLVKEGEVVATGVNEVHIAQDPTSHAELMAVRAASQKLGTSSLDGCIVYASGKPCPMCLTAMRLSGISEVYYVYSDDDGEPYGFSTAGAYAEIAKPLAEQAMKTRHAPIPEGSEPKLYAVWKERQGEEI